MATKPVFQVLVTSGNQAPLAAGSAPSALANGQVGVFDFHTGLSIDGTVLPSAQDIYLAVGINRTTGGTDAAEDLQKSAGQVLQVKNNKTYDVKAYVDEVAKVIEVTGFTAKCNSEYALKVEFRNRKSYGVNGYNQFAKTFSFVTGCCPATACDDCASSISSPVELAKGLADQINADQDKLITASLFGWKITAVINGAPTSDADTTVTIGTTTYTVPVLDADTTAQAAAKIVAAINTQANSPYRATLSGSTISIFPTTTGTTNTDTFAVIGAGVTANGIVAATKTDITDSAAFLTSYPGASAGLRITGVISARTSFNGSIPLKYYTSGTDFIVSMVTGLGLCNGTITTITNLQFPEGKGYDLQVLEYEAGGWNGKPGPYRQGAITGLQKDGFEYFASSTGNYTQLVLEYDQFSVGGWLEYLNNLRTIVAIPCADSTTLQGLVTILDRIFINRFDPLTNDVAGIDCTNAGTSTLTPTTDGISSLT